MTGSATGPSADIVLDRVGFAYPGGTEMVFDLTVPAGQIMALMGPSGSGKSNCPAANGSASRSPGFSFAIARFCCSTSPSPRWDRPCVRTCSRSWQTFSEKPA
jgi:ABC-type arginine transport system ATPase subunit